VEVLKLTKYSVDKELSAKIESELQMEKEMRDSEKLPANISDYLDSSSFEVGDSCPALACY
jgi:complement component 1 Q subcomponent-binding protein